MPKQRACKISGRAFIVHPAQEEFLCKLTRLNPELRANFPPPSVCPSEQIRLLSTYGNVCHLSRSKSALSGQELLTRFRPEEGYRVVTTEEFWSDRIDNIQCGRPYDFSKPLEKQWKDLLHSAYLLPLNSGNVENSDFVNSARNVRNSYLSFVIFDCEDCFYCYDIQRSHNCTACFSVRESQYCYECTDIHRCYECFFSTSLTGCNECIGCFDCRGCKRCIGCKGMDHADWCIFNEQVTPAEYAALHQEILCGSRIALERYLPRFPGMQLKQELSAHDVLNCEDCTGAHLRNCRNLVQCYGCVSCEDCGYLIGGFDSSDCWVGWGINSELCYQSVGSSLRNCHFCYHTYNCSSCFYSFMMNSDCNHCFGCVGLVKKSYCILNRQYSRADYFDLLPRIVAHLCSTGEWGEFFSPNVSPHPYEDSWADLHVEPEPLEIIRQRGYRLLTSMPQADAPQTIRETFILPDTVLDVNWADVSGKAIKCEESGKLFNIQKKELAFHCQYKLPLPRLHWERRLLHLAERKKRFPLV